MNNRPPMLSATFVRNVKVPGRYGDGRGLGLMVRPALRGGLNKPWTQSVRIDGRPNQPRPRPIAQELRDDNPAGEAIAAALPKTAVVRRHQRVLPHAEVRAALDRVRRCDAYRGVRLAFEFLVLTAARSGEVRHARWDEIDRSRALWTVPADRMKNGRALPQKTLSELMRALRVDAVPHGFRSSFRDWAAKCTDAPREVCELALAHVNGDRVEAAYRRSDLFDRRCALASTSTRSVRGWDTRPSRRQTATPRWIWR